MMIRGIQHLRVLVVDDEPAIRTAIVATLEAAGAHVVAVGSVAMATEACRRKAFDVALIDVRIGEDDGLDLLTSLLADGPWMNLVRGSQLRADVIFRLITTRQLRAFVSPIRFLVYHRVSERAQ